MQRTIQLTAAAIIALLLESMNRLADEMKNLVVKSIANLFDAAELPDALGFDGQLNVPTLQSNSAVQIV